MVAKVLSSLRHRALKRNSEVKSPGRGQSSEMWETGGSSHFGMNLASSVLIAVNQIHP